jgi:2,3,4,5-tetrahydropyridine-2-carboxylate N-succinyltransferase
MNMHVARAPMRVAEVARVIEDAHAHPEMLTPGLRGPVADAVAEAMAGLDAGTLRAAERVGGTWRVNHWLLKAIVVASRIEEFDLIEGGPRGSAWWDKGPGKFDGWGAAEFRASGIRAVPGAQVRHGVYVAPGAVVLPSFVAWGARIEERTLVDAFVNVGSCAQIGRNVHVSTGVCIGGVIEPAQERPVIIEDDCFIGARCTLVEGVLVREGAVLAAGTTLSASTKIVDRTTGEVHQGEVPPYAVVVPGSMPSAPLADGSPGPLVHCAVIVKRVDAATRAKTGLNEIFRG